MTYINNINRRSVEVVSEADRRMEPNCIHKQINIATNVKQQSNARASEVQILLN